MQNAESASNIPSPPWAIEATPIGRPDDTPGYNPELDRIGLEDRVDTALRLGFHPPVEAGLQSVEAVHEWVAINVTLAELVVAAAEGVQHDVLDPSIVSTATRILGDELRQRGAVTGGDKVEEGYGTFAVAAKTLLASYGSERNPRPPKLRPTFTPTSEEARVPIFRPNEPAGPQQPAWPGGFPPSEAAEWRQRPPGLSSRPRPVPVRPAVTPVRRRTPPSRFAPERRPIAVSTEFIGPEQMETLRNIPVISTGWQGKSDKSATRMETAGVEGKRLEIELDNPRLVDDVGFQRASCFSDPNSPLKPKRYEEEIRQATFEYTNFLKKLCQGLESNGPGGYSAPFVLPYAGDYHFATTVPLRNGNDGIICAAYMGSYVFNEQGQRLLGKDDILLERGRNSKEMAVCMFETTPASASTFMDLVVVNPYAFPAFLAEKCGSRMFRANYSDEIPWGLLTTSASSVTTINYERLKPIFVQVPGEPVPQTPFQKDLAERWKLAARRREYPNGLLQLGGPSFWAQAA